MNISYRAMLWALAISGMLLFQAVVLYLFGQPLISASGHVLLWVGEVLGPENSQQISDWYTLSHIIHGFLFYALLWVLFPRMPIMWRLLLAMGIEIGWELAENTPWVINHYREQALAQGYSGDSVINSVCDTIAMMGGFALARRLPVWSTVTLLLVFELFTGYMIRDGLFLNILGFIHQFECITRWQLGR